MLRVATCPIHALLSADNELPAKAALFEEVRPDCPLMYHIDPDGDEMRQISETGTQSPFVTRTMLQSQALMRAFGLPDQAGRDDVLEIMMNLRGRLLRGLKIVADLEEAVQIALKPPPAEEAIAYTPHVADLAMYADNFLQQAKLAIGDAISLTSPLYGKTCGLPVRHAIKWARRLGTESALLRQLEANRSWIEHVQGLRNAVEHPQDDMRLCFINLGENPASVAADRVHWYLTGDDACDILDEMRACLDAILVLSEELLVGFLVENRRHKALTIVEVPIDQRDPKAPIRFRADLQL